MKRTFILLLSLLLASVVELIAATPPGPSVARPNVIFILDDDLGWVDTTLYGHTKFHQTPNLDRLA